PPFPVSAPPLHPRSHSCPTRRSSDLTDDKWAAAVSLNALAVTALDRRDVASARLLSQQNLEVWRELGDRAAVARSLSNLASVVKDRKSTRLNSSHVAISYAVFCLKKK